MNIANDVTELIGNTPIVKINSFSKDATILAKCEFLNPSHSVKDRAAFFMLKDAMDKGLINEKTTIIEPTSGNTGVALAMLAAHYNLKMILTMPSSMSIERQKLLSAFGAKIVLTDPKFGMKGAVDEANKLASEISNSFIPMQFENLSNREAHKKTTAMEILRDTDGKIDFFVASFGTGGTLSGTAEILKQNIPNLKVIGVEPEDSPLLTKGYAGSHKIQGIGANFIPKNLNQDVVNEFVGVSNKDAFDTAKMLATKDGLLVGISSGANVFVSSQIAKENKGKTIITMLNDTGERYLSTDLFK
ncbi:cysteine synthase A [Campylobacter sputorum subsp. bubulus]|uniref:Cysteine synthase n=1 Tax=Campylobacter sputorum subsp. sputorum TaxID=32024 RepID=A0A381DLK4_9BACT|nr:cysteine synthase A [Campylobacter sputorum]ASM34834.1 cysteine synthase [Campylobacter sputorum aubsp. sputorum RM3237]KAB0581610.1 cysteine synthase A [Campylobacter sputorum subsp. sputorum]QEL05027.1 cysteine synthase [Campylobacter sputorum subsp. sputorum]SUX10211.1 cysteine synthase A [Campylobacter sputorum subsp. bubulus]SUX11515.1 cysteine synthase A [Campylobacter sputorum subsp. sputorum]